MTQRARGASYSIEHLTCLDSLDALYPEWLRLFQTSATPNPFAHPIWMMAWARHFVSPAALFVVTVRDESGNLVGVAPFYRQLIGLGPGLHAAQLHLLGAGQHTGLTELPQITVLKEQERTMLRAIVGYLWQHTSEWDWIELAMTPEQGWFEPEWLPGAGPSRGGFVLHKATRPCVVLPLPASWDELRASLKRNVRESIRRGVNSLARDRKCWHVAEAKTRTGLTDGLNTIIALHHARANLRGKVRHSDYVSTESDRAFLHDAARLMFAAGYADVCLLRVEEAAVAGRLMLRGNNATFCSLSGFDPDWWPYNVATTLMAECVRRAIAHGDTSINLSCGPDVAKLRWSEQLRLHQVFVMVGPGRRSRMAFTLFWQARAAHQVRRESTRYDDD